jgi:predicted 3-demethylubiquinone-9 3-methyltransferase (glyoxalase superfamily)
MQQKITPFLWFTDNAEQAMEFYVSVFKNARVKSVSRYTAAGPGPEGSVMVADFEIEGQEFTVLNGGPIYSLSPAISFVIHCETQDEVDYYWGKLADGAKELQCGWVTDKFGVSWQVVPKEFLALLGRGDAERSQRMMKAMFTMQKLDMPALKAAYEGV